MENLSTEVKQFELETPKEEYNNIPVVYCKHCLSLAIRHSDGIDYCDKCGGTETGEAHIHEWEEIYGKKYGGSYLTNNKNGREKEYENRDSYSKETKL